MSGRVAEITRRYQPVGADLSLNTEVPLSDSHIRAVIIRRREAAEWQPGNIFRQVLAERYWKRISTRVAGPRFIEIHCVQLHAGIPWRKGRGISAVYACGIIVERSSREPDRRSAVTFRIPGDSQARRKIQPLVVESRSARESRIRIEEEARIDLVAA